MTTRKTCPMCKQRFTRPPGVRPYDWKRRKTCSRACSHALGSSTRVAVHGLPTDKVCPMCSTTFQRRKGESMRKWAAREVCGRACAARKREHALPTTKACRACGATFDRRDNESQLRWKNRKACSRACAHALVAAVTTKPMPAEKVCPVCSVTFHRREGERPHRWRDRKTCSAKCGKFLGGQNGHGSRPQLPPPPTRYCPTCSKQLEQRANENRSSFIARKTCGGSCASRYSAAQKRAKGLTPGMHAASRTPPARLATIRARLPERLRDTLAPAATQHPELLEFLAGVGVDRWFPYSRAEMASGPPPVYRDTWREDTFTR